MRIQAYIWIASLNKRYPSLSTTTQHNPPVSPHLYLRGMVGTRSTPVCIKKLFWVPPFGGLVAREQHLCDTFGLASPPREYISLFSSESLPLGSLIITPRRIQSRVCPPFHHSLPTPESTDNGCTQATPQHAISNVPWLRSPPSGHTHTPLPTPPPYGAPRPRHWKFKPPAHLPTPTPLPETICHLANAQQINAHPKCTALRDTKKHTPRPWAGQPRPFCARARVYVRARAPAGVRVVTGGAPGEGTGEPRAPGGQGRRPRGPGAAGGGRKGRAGGPAGAGPG